MNHYYNVLGVSRKADEGEIKRAYHRQSLKVHPDKPGGSTKAFQELDLAHKVLTNRKRRERCNLNCPVWTLLKLELSKCFSEAHLHLFTCYMYIYGMVCKNAVLASEVTIYLGLTLERRKGMQSTSR
jgi:preprotein translocase subunit Sec63